MNREELLAFFENEVLDQRMLTDLYTHFNMPRLPFIVHSIDDFHGRAQEHARVADDILHRLQWSTDVDDINRSLFSYQQRCNDQYVELERIKRLIPGADDMELLQISVCPSNLQLDEVCSSAAPLLRQNSFDAIMNFLDSDTQYNASEGVFVPPAQPSVAFACHNSSDAMLGSYLFRDSMYDTPHHAFASQDQREEAFVRSFDAPAPLLDFILKLKAPLATASFDGEDAPSKLDDVSDAREEKKRSKPKKSPEIQDAKQHCRKEQSRIPAKSSRKNHTKELETVKALNAHFTLQEQGLLKKNAMIKQQLATLMQADEDREGNQFGDFFGSVP